MNKIIIYTLIILVVVCCKNKKKKDPAEEVKFFSVLSYLQAQVKKVDTSLYRITKIEIEDGRSDTTIVPREKFRDLARDFVTIPDISSEEKKENYESSNVFDETLNHVLMTYTTKDPDEEVRRQTIMVEPNISGEESKVKTIIIDWMKSTDDSLVQKNMTWHVDNHFQVIKKIEKSDQPEKIKILRVKWE
jgi:hypothetical protein